MQLLMSFFHSLALIGFTSFAALCYADAAKVISQQGDTQWRGGMKQAWQVTHVDLPLAKGNHVQTGALSKLALLFRDDSQLRLNQNSFLIVKDVLDEQGNSTRFRLNKGRAWVKSKNIPDKLIFETPSAVAAIRGTDWDIEVSDDGASKITVLHGEIYFSNEFGAVSVKANEMAVAEVGKAPVKLLVTNANARIQWVSEYTFAITQYKSLATTAKELAILRSNVQSTTQLQKSLNALPRSPFKHAALADVALYLGDTKHAISLIEQIANYQTIPELYVLWGRANLISGNPKILVGDNSDVLLLKAEIALFNGRGNEAIDFLNKVLKRENDNYDALYLLGRIFTEKEYTDLALNYLSQAKFANSQRFEAHAELATLHTYNNQFNLARSELADAKAKGAHGALVNTALGILSLKQGDLDAAKRTFLVATTLAPHYARANTYLAMTYYQQGQLELANDTLTYAIEQDDNDPMPYFMRAIFERELANPKQSLEAVIDAKKRLPNLKSLNQLANNLQGGTDLGAAYAEYGLTERALYTGLSNYDPTWAGSQLFVSSQIENNHSAKLSELFKGLLNDPTAFATSYTTQDMVHQPGINGVLRYHSNNGSGQGEHDWRAPSMQLNMYDNTYVPLSAMADFGEHQYDYASFDDYFSGERRNFQAGVGIKPTAKLNLFSFYNSIEDKSDPFSVLHEEIAGEVFTSSLTQQTESSNITDLYLGVGYEVSHQMTLDYGFSQIDFTRVNNARSQSIQTVEQILPSVEVTQRNTGSNKVDVKSTYQQDAHFLSLNYETASQSNIGFTLSHDAVETTNDSNNNSVVETYTRIYTDFTGEQISENVTLRDYLVLLSERVDIDSVGISYLSEKSQPLELAFFATQSRITNKTYELLLANEDDVISEQTKKLDDNKSFTSLGLGFSYTPNQDYAFDFNAVKTLDTGSVIQPNLNFLGNMLIDRQYMRTGSNTKQASAQLSYQSDNAFFRFKSTYQEVNSDLLEGKLFAELLDTSSELRELNSVVEDSVSRLDDRKQYYLNVKNSLIEARLVDYYFDYETLLDDRLSLRYAIRYTRAEDLYQQEPTEKPVDPFIQLPEFQTNLQLIYTTAFYAQSYFKLGFIDFYDSADAKTESKNTALLQLGWQQELFNKQLKLAAYYSQLPAHQKSDLYLNAEWRF